MKKLIITSIVTLGLAISCFANPHRGIHQPNRPHPSPIHHSHHDHHHKIIPSVIGGVMGGIISNTIRIKVWIPEQRIIVGYDINKNPIYHIIPGHWEFR